MNDLARMLILGGISLLIAGGLLFLFSRLGIGRLPGDVVMRRGNFTFYFPLMTSILLSILLSIVLSLVFWLFRRGR